MHPTKKLKKEDGSIGDLFTSLGTAPPVLETRFADLKERLRPPSDTLAIAWKKLESAIVREVAEIREKGSRVIPTVDFAEIEANDGNLPMHVASAVRRRGCVVVRNTIDAPTALAMKEETKQYIEDNKHLVGGFPKETPQVWEVYWSRPQGRMRQHPNVLKTQTALNRLWHCRALPGAAGQVAVDVHRPLTYGERLRIRAAGDKSFSLGPHVDGGSVERWEDDEYRKCYRAILSCDWEDYDGFDATHRADAQCDLYSLNLGACTVFRCFQGWISLSASGKGKGALMVVPILREATAFLMLRPFLGDVSATSFCGANPGKTHDLYPEFHQSLIDGLVATPDVGPGDSVWWHCDLIHAVEGVHQGNEDSSVYYVPAFPLCRKNAEYLGRQANNFREGKTPPDFPPNDSETRCKGRCTPDDLDELGLRAMGLVNMPDVRVDGESQADFDATKLLREECQRILSKEDPT